MKRLFFLSFLLCAPATAPAADCTGSGLDVLVLGSGGPEIDDGRASTGYLVRVDSRARVLIDTGTGTALRFDQSGQRFRDLFAIAFTHFHVDHSQDLPAYVKGSYFQARDQDLPVLGPSGNENFPGLNVFLDGLFGTNTGVWRYLNDYLNPDVQSAWKLRPAEISIDNPRWSMEFESLKLTAVPVHHGPLPALAWRVDGKGSSVVFSGDTSGRGDALIELARDADMLIAHNAVPEGASEAALNLHMSPSRIADIAREAGVRHLVLSHFMRRSLQDQQHTLDVISGLFAGTVMFARDMACLLPDPAVIQDGDVPVF